MSNCFYPLSMCAAGCVDGEHHPLHQPERRSTHDLCQSGGPRRALERLCCGESVCCLVFASLLEVCYTFCLSHVQVCYECQVLHNRHALLPLTDSFISLFHPLHCSTEPGHAVSDRRQQPPLRSEVRLCDDPCQQCVDFQSDAEGPLRAVLQGQGE